MLTHFVGDIIVFAPLVLPQKNLSFDSGTTNGVMPADVMCNCFAVNGKVMKPKLETHWKLWIILLIGCLNSVFSNQGSACQCFSGPPCDAYKYSSVVFVGELLGRQDSGFAWGNVGRFGILYSFKVTKWYKGTQSDEIQIMSGVGGGDCGYFFDKGIPYLIYADSIRGGILYTDICTRTRPLREATIDLSYLDNLPRSAEQTHVWGSVMEFDSLTDYYIKFKPRPRVEVSTVSNGSHLRTFSDSLGNFEFIDLPPDSYKFSITVPRNFELEYGDAYTEVRLVPSGCTTIPLTLVPDGRITGRILDSGGKPVPKIDVELVAVDSIYSKNSYLYIIGTSGYTNQNGQYTIRRVPPGQYFVGINLGVRVSGRQVYPPTLLSQRVARRVSIGLGEYLDNIDIRIDQ
ncbi:MAG TPA: hypothetical protein VL633_13405 [Bacteroidota bacterium]|nr:hypothetical protein [Bacteroidota bacterium]